jgi:quinol monooxygenase YgiN
MKIKSSISVLICLLLMNTISAQLNNPYVRIAKIVIDSSQLDNYKLAVKEHIETAVKVEPGVIALYAVYDKDLPTHVTVFEIYADKNAYEHHIQTAHFKKYKSTTVNMVKSLKLTDVIPIALAEKTGKIK